MAVVTFYEKPGCKGNLRQKTLLAAAGHTVQAKNLKTEAWTADRLLAFLGKLPVADVVQPRSTGNLPRASTGWAPSTRICAVSTSS
jgi:arsenate reductase-like glutaredoxin family protein